jgi:hypothetical protein
MVITKGSAMLGLSTDNPDGRYKTIEYAVYLYNDKIKDGRNNNTKANGIDIPT